MISMCCSKSIGPTQQLTERCAYHNKVIKSDVHGKSPHSDQYKANLEHGNFEGITFFYSSFDNYLNLNIFEL